MPSFDVCVDLKIRLKIDLREALCDALFRGGFAFVTKATREATFFGACSSDPEILQLVSV